MDKQKTGTVTAAQLITLLADILADDTAAKSSIRADYNKFKSKLSDSDARMLTAAKYLRSLIAKGPTKGN